MMIKAIHIKKSLLDKLKCIGKKVKKQEKKRLDILQ